MLARLKSGFSRFGGGSMARTSSTIRRLRRWRRMIRETIKPNTANAASKPTTLPNIMVLFLPPDEEELLEVGMLDASVKEKLEAVFGNKLDATDDAAAVEIS